MAAFKAFSLRALLALAIPCAADHDEDCATTVALATAAPADRHLDGA
jgi:hypothetical protein